MKKSDYYYSLPEELIAQRPLEDRSASRLMLLDRRSGAYDFRHFYDIADLLNEGDLLVMNDSRVIPARLFGFREDTGREVEVLMLHESGELWECLVKPGRKLKAGDRIVFGDILRGEIKEITTGGNRLIKFEHEGVFLEILDKLGQTPLPPYIREKLEDPERYQTVYAKNPGSAAAPTAGLHFTPELIKKLEDKGVGIKFVTLHVGLGTFRPVKEENIENHIMHSEYCVLPEDTAEEINRTKRRGGRVIPVGTTSLRTIEAFAANGRAGESSGWTDIFIYPGYEFKLADGLITNFHLPESTLLMLVSALAGRENVLNAYKAAIAANMRFFSFGDAMLII
ncbi:MAG: tRNA preQ1(34) S-adenosylmethionine ribosyltransferase-isomerase QueA [Oscillospiraceae bacterium]|jgi:S-adenosylmethionine:tRNA ribosyltransferase-isomerase|nr:tRNA preQ1(34) S-adenosylmethionine ribosyltransferase-isomerase QueA [Oscillospiraceae bacterium]